MYIAKLAITNLRCFRRTTVEFQPGINVILGENNAGKTALLCALRLVFERSGRLRPDLPDFYQGIADFTQAPTISVTATLRSSTADTLPVSRTILCPCMKYPLHAIPPARASSKVRQLKPPLRH